MYFYIVKLVLGVIMNKKLCVRGMLLIFLLINPQAFGMQTKLIHYAMDSALLSTGFYGLAKLTARYMAYTSEDMPERVDTWVRKIYAKNGLKNADSVPLKIGKGSFCFGGHFIALDRKMVDSLDWRLCEEDNSENEFVLEERVALHELKHLKNGDCGKGILVRTCTLSPLLRSSSSFPVLIVKYGMIMGAHLIYTRYVEAEAERSAYMNIPSLDQLEIIKQDNIRQGDDFEWDLRHHFNEDCNLIEGIIRPIISKKLYTLDQKKVESNNQKERLAIDLQQKKLINLAAFAFDWQHPDWQRCGEIAQECIDKRKCEA